MGKHGPNFYDEEKVFDYYSNHRLRTDTPNETIEQPILWDLIGNPKGLAVLDLGCGDARIAKKFKELGAKSYLGIEGSRRMFEKALTNVEAGFSEASQCWLEDFIPQEKSYDLAVSSLAMHYVDNVLTLMKKVHSSLKGGGRFIFSMEHPVITSSNKSLEGTTVRQDWIVDGYFERGPRNVQWMGDTVTIYHRTVEDYVNLVNESGFSLQGLKESDPDIRNFEDKALWERRKRIPLFLTIAALKQ